MSNTENIEIIHNKIKNSIKEYNNIIDDINKYILTLKELDGLTSLSLLGRIRVMGILRTISTFSSKLISDEEVFGESTYKILDSVTYKIDEV